MITRAEVRTDKVKQLRQAELAALRTVAALAGFHIAIEGDALRLAVEGAERSPWLAMAYDSAVAKAPEGALTQFSAAYGDGF